MKKYLTLILLFIPLALFGQVDPEPVVFTWKLLLPILLGLYEIVIRFIPTVNDLSWLSWIIKLIAFLNEFFNRKKKK